VFSVVVSVLERGDELVDQRIDRGAADNGHVIVRLPDAQSVEPVHNALEAEFVEVGMPADVVRNDE
jgi:hypothetical protein